MTPEELQEILDSHALWLDSRGAQGVKANLESADLRRIDLRGGNLRFAHMQSADLREARLMECNLERADLPGARLQGTDLKEANLRGADLSDANLENAVLNRADLGFARLQQSSLKRADLYKANMQYADLRSADLRGANLRSADLSEAFLGGANLEGADLEGANFKGADLEKALLVNTEFWRARALSSSVNKAILNNDNSRQQEGDTSQHKIELQLQEAEESRLLLENQLADVSKQLEEATQGSEEAKKLQKDKAALENQNAQANEKVGSLTVRVDALKAENDRLKQEMDIAVEAAVSEMRTSVDAAGRAKRTNTVLSYCAMTLGVSCYIAAVAIIMWMLFYKGGLLSVLENFGLNEIQNGWQLIPVYLPVAAFLSIGTALFRHEAKIRSQSSFLLEQITHAEKAAGLLKIATKLETIPDEKLERIVHPTFIDIRRSLLNMGAQPSVASEEDAGNALSDPKGTLDVAAKASQLKMDK